MGAKPLVVPLQATAPTGAPMPPGPHAAMVLTSAAAAREAARRGAPSLPVHAIGDATARAAREAGLGPIVAGAGGEWPVDGAELGRTLAPAYRGERLLYPCAEGRRRGLEAALEAGGAQVDAWPLYRTAALPEGGARLRAALDEAAPDAVLLYSPEGARALAAAWDARLAAVPLACMSGAVVEALPDGLGGGRWVAERPDERSLLAMVARMRR